MPRAFSHCAIELVPVVLGGPVLSRISVATGLASLALACGGRSTCEVAQDKLRECEAQRPSALGTASAITVDSRLPPLDLSDCSAPGTDCFSRCVANSSCAAINYVLSSPGTDPNIPTGAFELQGCINGCVEQVQLGESVGGAATE